MGNTPWSDGQNGEKNTSRGPEHQALNHPAQRAHRRRMLTPVFGWVVYAAEKKVSFLVSRMGVWASLWQCIMGFLPEWKHTRLALMLEEHAAGIQSLGVTPQYHSLGERVGQCVEAINLTHICL